MIAVATSPGSRAGLSDQILATDFATSAASAAGVEGVFTPVPCISGKTYTFEVEFWVKWATAGTSGPAVPASSVADPGTPTVGANRMLHWVDAVLVGSGGAEPVDSTNASMAASANWTNYRATGFFAASSSANFNFGLNVAGWDSGDVVTVAKGARLTVQQVD